MIAGQTSTYTNVSAYSNVTVQPAILPLALNEGTPGGPSLVVEFLSAYTASDNATTYVTTDGSDPMLTNSSRVWFTGTTAWNMTLQVGNKVADVRNTSIAST